MIFILPNIMYIRQAKYDSYIPKPIMTAFHS